MGDFQFVRFGPLAPVAVLESHVLAEAGDGPVPLLDASIGQDTDADERPTQLAHHLDGKALLRLLLHAQLKVPEGRDRVEETVVAPHVTIRVEPSLQNVHHPSCFLVVDAIIEEHRRRRRRRCPHT